jgi:HEAT repeat protein
MRYFLLITALILVSGCGKAKPAMAGAKWAEALHDSDPKQRKRAAFTLGNIGPSDPAGLPALIGALEDKDAGVRREAILALVKFGLEAKSAVPMLAKLRQNDRDAQVRKYAGMALEKL